MKRISLIILTTMMVLIISACNINPITRDKGQQSQNNIQSTSDSANVSETIEETDAYIHGNSLGIFPIDRTTEGILLDHEEVAKLGDKKFDLDYYRNLTYDAGLEGKYTFLVINPVDDPDDEAPLWVYFHGGAGGYFNEDGDYIALERQDEMSWNKEETFEGLVEIMETRLYKNGKLFNNTLKRRLDEGYRMLVVSYSDHDFYSGTGTEYTNNPLGGEVNGLQASMSAVDYVTQNYATSHVFAHGTSAGAIGAYSLGLSYYMEGIKLSGIISDSMLPTSKIGYVIEEQNGHPDAVWENGFDMVEMMEKTGPFGNEEYRLSTAEMINMGYDVPMLGIGGTKDPYFGDHIYTIPMAVEAGFDSNCDWLHHDIFEAIDNQENSPHDILLLDAGHVSSLKTIQGSDYVDYFIDESLDYNDMYPFEDDDLSYNDDHDHDSSAQFTVETYVYKESFGLDMELDFYRPADSSYDELPVLVFYHGGGYRGGSKGDSSLMFGDDIRGRIREEYLMNGYAVVSCNYILTYRDTDIDIEDCWIDGKDSIRWLRKNAELLGIDGDNIGVMGSSAGGGMATMLGYTEDDQFIGDSDLAGYSSSVNYVINMWGAAHYNVEPIDFRELESLDELDTDVVEKFNEDLYRIGLSDDDDFETILVRSIELTPTTYLDDGDVPTISFYGEEDVTTHVTQGTFLHEELDELGIENELYTYEGEGHGLKGLSDTDIEKAGNDAFAFGHSHYVGDDH